MTRARSRLWRLTDEDGWPEGLVIEHVTPVSGDGRFVAALVLAGRATGLPEMQLTLPGAPISGGDVALWTLEDGDSRSWSAVDDLFAAEPTDEQFALDARSGRVVFGDGEHGRVPPIGAWILCRYSMTAAEAGNLANPGTWRIGGGRRPRQRSPDRGPTLLTSRGGLRRFKR